ncbi:MAG: hypothetical protein HP057_03160, partial [Erysipelatoclostridium sp.]|nr:hypothetical protein [Thomasclavelia sp.]
MELHIREFEYQNIIKQQFYKQLVVLSLYVLLLVFALESILYGFDYVWIILFVAAMAIINLNFRYYIIYTSKKRVKALYYNTLI